MADMWLVGAGDAAERLNEITPQWEPVKEQQLRPCPHFATMNALPTCLSDMASTMKLLSAGGHGVVVTPLLIESIH